MKSKFYPNISINIETIAIEGKMFPRETPKLDMPFGSYSWKPKASKTLST